MVYKQHTFLLVLRLLLILAVMMGFPFVGRFMDPGQLVFTYLLLAIVLILLVIELYFFLNRTLRELTKFLEHIRNREFNLRFPEEKARGLRRNFFRIFNEILEVYRDIRIEKEAQFKFLEHMIELIEIGIIVFDQNGKVVLSNTAATHLISVPVLSSWEQIGKRNPGLNQTVGSIVHSGKVLYESGNSGSGSKLAIQVSLTRMLDENYSLMTIQDISGMVEHNETGAWMRLLSTLNHEIKNSITPINSLADTLMLILKDDRGNIKPLEELDQENLSDINTAVETLQQRGKSLFGFIDEYHKLTRIPAPDPEQLNCNILLESVSSVFQSELSNTNIRLLVRYEDPVPEIRADRGMIEQVLINLIRNSLDAVAQQSHPEIVIGSYRRDSGVSLYVMDNGEGIEKELLEDVFIPFFSNKKQGSGIGLSLVRQIMRLHGGDVRIESTKGEGTTVTLGFI